MSVAKYDNAFKQKVLLQEIDKKVADIKRQTYKKELVSVPLLDKRDGEIVFADILHSSYDDMIKPYRKGYNFIDCADRLLDSRYRKAKKVRDKIANLVLTNSAVFITLTFKDSVLSKTSDLTRRRYVARYLKSNCREYVANVDFGALNGREHYHAVVSSDIDFKDWYKYGAIQVERVRPLEDSSKRISRYITKLTNHALKVGCVAPRLIYSRLTY